MTFKHKITGTQAKLAEDGKYYIHNCSIGIPKQFIEESKVWEKKDGYEVLSFILNEKLFENKDEFGKYWCKEGTYAYFIEVFDYSKINSIKRLSDGEIFSMGDRVKSTKYTLTGTIWEIKIVNNDLCFSYFNSDIKGYLEDILKVKKPILVTEDGEELFGGESIYGVTDDFQLCYTSITTKENVQRCRVFTKKENAETFIKENKPQYSLNDIRNVLTKQMEDIHWIMME